MAKLAGSRDLALIFGNIAIGDWHDAEGYSQSATRIILDFTRPDLGIASRTILTGTGFTFDGSGKATGGQVTGWASYQDGKLLAKFSEFSLPLTEVLAFATANDSEGLLATILAGNDLISGSKLGDALIGFDFSDTLLGGEGNDTLSGGDGGDRLDGGDGADYLDGQKGDDRLIGGANGDIFVFTGGGGTDTITDFTPGLDKIKLVDFDVHSFADVLAHMQVRPGGGIHLDFGSNWEGQRQLLRLPTVSLASLSASDFILPDNFAPTAISLSGTPGLENTPGRVYLGTLGVADPDAGDTHVVTSLDPAFAVEGNALYLIEGQFLPDYEDHQSLHSYRVPMLVRDQAGLVRSLSVTVDLGNVVEPWSGQGEFGGRVPNENFGISTFLLANEHAQEASVRIALDSVGSFATDAGGRITITVNGVANYEPAAGFVGNDSFTYTMVDALGQTGSATVNFHAFTNHAPVLSLTDKLFTARMNGAEVGLLNVVDADGDAVWFTVTDELPDELPEADFEVVWRDDGYHLKLMSGQRVVVAADVAIRITATDSWGKSTSLDTVLHGLNLTYITGNMVVADDAAGGNVASVNTGLGYTLSVVGGDALSERFEVRDGTLALKAGASLDYDAGETSAEIVLGASDGRGGLAELKPVTVRVRPMLDAAADTYILAPGATISRDALAGLLANDTAAGPGLVVDDTSLGLVSKGKEGGTFIVAQDGSFSYAAAPGFIGLDSFTVKVTDAFGSTDKALVTFLVDHAPEETGPIGDLSIRSGADRVALQLKANHFTDDDADQSLDYDLKTADDGPLPDWLRFDAEELVLSVEADTTGEGTIGLRLTVSDGFLSVTDEFALDYGAGRTTSFGMEWLLQG